MFVDPCELTLSFGSLVKIFVMPVVMEGLAPMCALVLLSLPFAPLSSISLLSENHVVSLLVTLGVSVTRNITFNLHPDFVGLAHGQLASSREDSIDRSIAYFGENPDHVSCS